MIEVSTGGKEVLESKTFIALGLGETTIVVGQDAEEIRFILDFSVVEGSEQKINSKVIDDKSLRLELINFSSPFGTTFVDPLHVGTFKGRKLYLMINVAKIGEKGELRQVTLTTYLGEEVRDGAN